MFYFLYSFFYFFAFILLTFLTIASITSFFQRFKIEYKKSLTPKTRDEVVPVMLKKRGYDPESEVKFENGDLTKPDFKFSLIIWICFYISAFKTSLVETFKIQEIGILFSYIELINYFHTNSFIFVNPFIKF